MKAFSGTTAVLATTGLMVALIAGSCAKRPVVPVASAPAPPPPAVQAPATESTPPAPPAAPAPVSVPPPAPPPPPPPAPRSMQPTEFRSTDALKAIHFDFDKSTIRPNDANTLETNAAWLRTNPNYLLLIEGHCDERGTDEYNLALGERRATAAMHYLATQGVQSDRMTVISYGEQRPVCTAHTQACWAQNRRAQFLVKEQ